MMAAAMRTLGSPVEAFIRAWSHVSLAAEGKPRHEMFSRLQRQFEQDFPDATPAQHRRAMSVLGRVCRIDRYGGRAK